MILDRKAPQSRTEGTEGAMGGQGEGTIGDLSVKIIGEQGQETRRKQTRLSHGKTLIFFQRLESLWWVPI